MPSLKSHRIALIAAAVIGVTSLPAAATGPYSAIYAFGDSLSDNGNLFAATTALTAAGLFPGALPQAADYWNGRFSNGKVAVEVMAQTLGLPLANFAVGGARSDLNPTYPAPGGGVSTGLQAQVAKFGTTFNGAADPNGLYFVWIGGNDIRDALEQIPTAFATGGQAGVQNLLASTVQTLVQDVVLATGALAGMGAHNFFLPLLPDLGITPEGRVAQAAFDAAAPGLFNISDFSAALDLGLDSYYRSVLPGLLGGADVTTFNTLGLQRMVQSNPGAYGIGDVDTPCFLGYVGTPGALCTANFTTTNMYWDKVHPSAITHQVLGQAMAASVPEPASMLMLAVGVAGLLGWKRRQAV